jgi:two-component system LytT family response regulator
MRALIIDDEPLPAKHLQEMIQKNCFEITSTTVFTRASEALEHVKTEVYDLLFLDVEMPELNGFDFIEHANLPHHTIVIFITAYSHYAFEAFKANAVHYILKPVMTEELIKSVRKATLVLNADKKTIEKEVVKYTETLSIYDGEDYLILDVANIIRMEADGSYTKIISKTHAPILASKRMGHYEEKLDPSKFFRCHNSHLINLKELSRLSKGKSGYITLLNNEVIPVSGSKKEQLNQLLGL